MNNRGRNIFSIGLFLAISVGIFFFGRFLRSSDLNFEQPPIRKTITAIVGLNQTTEAQIHQTETADIHEVFFITVTPEPKTMTAIAGVTATYGIAHVMTQADLSGATYEFTATPIPYTTNMSPTAIPLPSRTPTTSPTLCPASDVICPGGNATFNPAQQVFQLMASAEGTEYAQLALTATALATSPTPTEYSSASPTPTSSAHDSNCAFSWAHQDLPEVAKAARDAFDKSGEPSISVIRADAYGEDCIKADGSISYFGAMTTDFYLYASVNNLSDMSALAERVLMAYKTLANTGCQNACATRLSRYYIYSRQPV